MSPSKSSVLQPFVCQRGFNDMVHIYRHQAQDMAPYYQEDESFSQNPSEHFQGCKIVQNEAQVDNLSHPSSKSFPSIQKTKSCHASTSDPNRVVVYEGYKFFKVDPIPGYKASWASVQRPQMPFSPNGFYNKVQRHANLLSKAQQYLELLNTRQHHVDQLTEEQRDASKASKANARRRGRGTRKNESYWAEYNSRDEKDIFDARECLFSDGKGNLRTPALANLDTGLKVPGGLIMSSQYAKDISRYQDISQDFDDPCLQSISGHPTPVEGVLRDVTFRLKGTSVTFKRDFFICDAINGLADIMLGANFITNHFRVLFERVKECMFAPWFSTKKESKEEKAERERLERDQKIKANQREIVRLQKEQLILERAQRQSQGTASHQ